MKKIVLIVIIILSIGVGMIYFFLEYGATVFQYKKIIIGSKCVYLKHKARGLNYEELSISTSKSRRISSSIDYLYNSECLFYQIQNDTIFIFSREIANKPPKFNSKIHIIQKSVTNSEFMNLYKTYKTLGYEQFPPAGRSVQRN